MECLWGRQRHVRLGAQTLNGKKRSLEAQIMDWADDVTYAVHDMDDFYRAGLVPLDRLYQNDSPELDSFQGYLRAKHPEEADSLCRGAERCSAAFWLSTLRTLVRPRNVLAYEPRVPGLSPGT